MLVRWLITSMDSNLNINIILDKIFSILKDWLPYISTILLASWGGFVSYIQKVRIRTTIFSWRELIYDLVISSFAGFLTYLLCLYANVPGTISSILIAISGHMGARALAKFERFRDAVLGLKGLDDSVESKKDS